MIRFLTIVILLIATPSLAVESRIYAQRVSPSGFLIGSPFAVASTADGVQQEPMVSFYNDRFLVVWQEWNGKDLDVKGARIGMDGTVLDATPLEIDTGARNQMRAAVDADTSGWVVVNTGFDTMDVLSSLFIRRVDYDGTVNAETEFGATSGVGANPKMAYDSVSGKYHVLFESIQNTGGNSGNVLKWSLITPDLTSITTTGNKKGIYGAPGADFIVSASAAPNGGFVYTLSFSGVNPFGRSHPNQIAIHFEEDASLNPNGYVHNFDALTYIYNDHASEYLDSNQWPIKGSDITEGANYAIAIWTRCSIGGIGGAELYDGDLYAGRVDDYDLVEDMGGTLVSAEISGGDYYDEYNPSIASDQNGTALTAYNSDFSGATSIKARILTVDGTGITPGSPITIRDTKNGNRRTDSDVAYGDDGVTQEFLVVWVEGWWGVQ